MTQDELLATAQDALEQAYAPYSQFRVGAALLFADGTVVTGTNVENASYGLSLCAETVAVARAFGAGRRGGLVAVAVAAEKAVPVPCGRCRQVLHELASLDGADPAIACAGGGERRDLQLSVLLPDAFGPGHLGITG